jgi:hypothetical protein
MVSSSPNRTLNQQQSFKTLIKWLQIHEVTKVVACMGVTDSYDNASLG